MGVMVFPTVCEEMSVCQYVTLCDCMSARKWEVCGVKMALMELDVVHNRQDITSERELNESLRVKEKDGSDSLTSKVPQHTVQSQTLLTQPSLDVQILHLRVRRI